MLIWMCALRCEAKPVIDFYRLKKSRQNRNHVLYQGNHSACIVSGIGNENMSDAIAWGATLFSQPTGLFWFNLGIAGHMKWPPGTPVLVTEATWEQTDRIVATPPNNQPFPGAAVISLPGERTEYDRHALFDMEAHAFFRAASRFSPLANCQSLKVISDNEQVLPNRNKSRISRLISTNMPAITRFAEQYTTHGMAAT